MIFPILSVLFGISLFYYFRQRKAEKEMDEIVSTLPSSSNEKPSLGTRDLCLELLRQLNCVIQTKGDDIHFSYQGERFMIEASNESLYITIWDLQWFRVGYEDDKRMQMVKKVINHTNYFANDTVLYLPDDEDKAWYVLSKSQHLFMPAIPDIERYLAALLASFFRTKQCFSDVLESFEKENVAEDE